ncbi:MAG: hypothetical protein QM723_35495 [Myxococcaceae bacterium]
MIELATMAVLASAVNAEARPAGTLEGWLKIDGVAAQPRAGACDSLNTVLASVVMIELDTGAAVARVDITCADPAMRFTARLPKGWYQAVVWPGADLTNLVERPYAFNTPVFVGGEKVVVGFEELTVPFAGAVAGKCEQDATLILIDTEEPYAKTVAAKCVEHQLRFETRIPRGTYEAIVEVQGKSRTLTEGMMVNREVNGVVLGAAQVSRR